jgi:hypothetical protein
MKIPLILGLATLVVLGLFLLPVVPVTFDIACNGMPGCPHVLDSGSSSITYSYFGVGAVQVQGYNGGHAYCLMHGSPSTVCGIPLVLQR